MEPELEPLVLDVARTSAPAAQQRLCRAVVEQARRRLRRWEGDTDRVLALAF